MANLEIQKGGFSYINGLTLTDFLVVKDVYFHLSRINAQEYYHHITY